MIELRLYLAQRTTAAIMAPLVLLHLGVMIYAIQGGLSADEILERTRGSLFWGGTEHQDLICPASHRRTIDALQKRSLRRRIDRQTHTATLISAEGQ